MDDGPTDTDDLDLARWADDGGYIPPEPWDVTDSRRPPPVEKIRWQEKGF